MKLLLSFLLLIIMLALPAIATPLPYAVAPGLPDAAVLSEPFEAKLGGYLGERIANNEKNRLLEVDENDLLDAFERRDVPHQDWQGEHVGKFLHAATLAWVYTGDATLKDKLDRVVARLIKTQEADGYLGTYPAAKRWTSWDVWVHKYDLMGLLTYYHYTGDAKALQACRRIGDLLAATFPAKKSIIQAGEHMGMAATSVLEPMVLLYRTTGDQKYLDFAHYIVRAWDEPGGPRIIHTLLTEKAVNKTANGKAYEMLSNLVGLCELARATGDKSLLQPVLIAWQDIVAHQLYITGTASHREHFSDPDDLPNDPGSNVGETCVTVTWIQLNAQLLRLTGEARFGNEMERSYYNHLAGSQRPDGSQWCYYTPLEGAKPYGNSTNCCLSSGPRGMALLPQIAYLRTMAQGKAGAKFDGVAVNLLETSRAVLPLGGQTVTIEQQSKFPRSGQSVLTFHLKVPATFGLKVRTPSWAQPLSLRIVGGNPITGAPDGWTTLPPHRWKDGDKVTITFHLGAAVVNGQHSDAGRQAMTFGPFVMAYDERRNPGLASFNAVALDGGFTLWPDMAYPIITTRVITPRSATPKIADMVPFAEASRDGGRFAVWLHTPGDLPRNLSLLAGGQAARSHEGNVAGDIADGDPATYVVTYDGDKHELDWFSITLEAPISISRIVFAHGHSFHDGGWFDSSQGKPQVQAQLTKNGQWQTSGTLDDYPATTATDNHGLKDGQEFTLHLAQPATIVALRVIGTPATGDDPKQSFASCGELAAFEK